METPTKSDRQTGIFCIYCGEHLTGNEAFCPRCGKPVYRPAQTNTTASYPPSSPSSRIVTGTDMYTPAKPSRQSSANAAGRRKWLGLAAILLAAGAITCLILVFGPFGGGSLVPNTPQHAVIKPSSSETVVKFGQMRVVIPGGTVSNEETLTLEKKDGLPLPMKELEPLTPAFDLSLGDLTAFEDPLLVEIPYDAAKLGQEDPTGAFIAMYYDEASQLWDAVPCETDPEEGVVRLTLYHLTQIQCYFSRWEGQNVYDNGTVSVIYLWTGNGDKFNKYEEVVGAPTGDDGAPRFVEDVAKNATKILEAYKGLGLKVPDHPKIYVTADKNNYNSLTGNVSLSVNIATQADPESEMLRNLAHELFHTAQQATLGSIYYQATKGQNIDFWLEATADYMGNTGVWQALNQTPVDKYEYYGVGFFDVSLFTTNGSHEYDAASFVKYMQDQLPASPLQLVNMAASIQPVQKSFLSVYGGKYDSMLGWYEEFMAYSLFDNSSRFLSKNNAKLQESILNRTDFSFELDANGKPKPDVLPIEGSGSLSFKDQYTAGFHVFTANCDTTLTMTPGKTVVLYLGSTNNAGRGYETRIDAFGGEAVTLTLTKGDFLLVAQVSALPGSISFSYEALPAKPDLTGTWDLSRFEYIDCEGDSAFWAAVGEGLGLDKTSYLSANNEALQQSGGSFFLSFSSTDGETYTVSLGNTAQAEIITFTDVTITGSEIVCSGKLNDLWASLTLQLSADGMSLSGVFRAQTVYYYGDGTFPATDVIAVTALRQ